ncbi:protein LTO1 homolog isoform X2 [Phascolarctos cinereus]
MNRSPDLFDAIVMAEERYHGEAYQEGYAEGSSLGLTEGRRYGVSQGANVGSEIGCYQGFAFTWKCLLSECTTEKDRCANFRSLHKERRKMRTSAPLPGFSASGCVFQQPDSERAWGKKTLSSQELRPHVLGFVSDNFTPKDWSLTSCVKIATSQSTSPG